MPIGARLWLRTPVRRRPAEHTCPPLQPQARLCPQDSGGGWAVVNAHAKSSLTLETTADTPVRNRGPGRSLPEPVAGHPLQAAGPIATDGSRYGNYRRGWGG